MPRVPVAIGLSLLCLCLALSVQAHKPSDSYLNLDITGPRIDVQWDIALRDLEQAIGLDGNGDDAITWGELSSRKQAVAAYAQARLQLSATETPCDFGPADLKVARHTDGSYAVLLFAAQCPGVPAQIRVDYDLLFQLDPLHRGLLRLSRGDTTHTAVLSPEAPSQTFTTGQAPAVWQTFQQYFELGVWHIWIGFDHLLFLAGLLLPVVLRRAAGRWRPVSDLRSAGWNAVALVTAFTLAHSITLVLGTLNVVNAPARWVESAIAATLIVTALNNFWPLVKPRRLWMLAFGFGLIHGLGFASVLAGLGLPGNARTLALAAFNIGVEAGQLVMLAAFLPLVYALRHLRSYQSFVVPAGSLAIAVFGALWLLERSMNIDIGVL
jgi:hypothetical protein